jgi:phage/plasmid-associated DNA primase
MSALELLGENAPAFSDEDLALRFAARHADDLRFVAAWNRWLVWDGKHWQFEDTLRAWDFARQICRDAATQCNKAKAASGIASAKTVYAVERLARSDRRLAATIDQWDTDPWHLNTPQGVIDLATGQSRPHIPEDYITKITAVAPQGDCPRFLEYMNVPSLGASASSGTIASRNAKLSNEHIFPSVVPSAGVFMSRSTSLASETSRERRLLSFVLTCLSIFNLSRCSPAS